MNLISSYEKNEEEDRKSTEKLLLIARNEKQKYSDKDVLQ
jgi:hypothetical protein